MKAIDILRWVAYQGYSGDGFLVVNIDEYFSFLGYFGYDFETEKYGNYFVYYTDSIDEESICFPLDDSCHKLSEPVFPDFSIECDVFDKYGNKVFIRFYRLED